MSVSKERLGHFLLSLKWPLWRGSTVEFFCHCCLAFIFPGFCHVFGRFSYVKCDFTEMKSFPSGNRLSCLLFIHILFQVIRVFSAFQDKLEQTFNIVIT